MSGQGDQPAQDIQYSYDAIKSAIILEIDKKKTSELVDDINWLDTKSKKIKWLLMIIGVLCAATPFMPFLGLPAGIAGAPYQAVLVQLGRCYSHDKIKTISKGIVCHQHHDRRNFRYTADRPLSFTCLVVLWPIRSCTVTSQNYSKVLALYRKKLPHNDSSGFSQCRHINSRFSAFVFTMSMCVVLLNHRTRLNNHVIVAPYIVIPVIVLFL